MSDRSIYEIRIGDKGTVTTDLKTEGTQQTLACAKILTLTRSLGQVTGHDELQGTPQPVNVGLSIPGVN